MKNMDNRFDEQLRGITDLQWLPWIGKDYFSDKNDKVLILGESHYIPDGEEEEGYLNSEWTRNFIRKEGLKQPPLYQGNLINKLVANTERAIFNSRYPSDEQKIELWQGVAFFNLIQRLLSSRKDVARPNGDDFYKGWKVFFDIVDIIDPKVCLVLGKSSWGPLGGYMTNNKDWMGEFRGENVAIISKDDRKIKLIFIKHPSSYFSWTKWAEALGHNATELTKKFRV